MMVAIANDAWTFICLLCHLLDEFVSVSFLLEAESDFAGPCISYTVKTLNQTLNQIGISSDRHAGIACIASVIAIQSGVIHLSMEQDCSKNKIFLLLCFSSVKKTWCSHLSRLKPQSTHQAWLSQFCCTAMAIQKIISHFTLESRIMRRTYARSFTEDVIVHNQWGAWLQGQNE